MDQRDPIARIERLVDNGAHELLIPRTDCGMVAATGVIKGNKVIIFASDATKQGGALGADGARVIVAAYKAAMAAQLPIIGIWHSGGARLSDGVSSLSAFGEVFSAMVAASGRIPQLSLILGPAAGGGCHSLRPALQRRHQSEREK
jgi:acetyl-CoA/propionyl-CoA carboxylase carboxyl transferase subunit